MLIEKAFNHTRGYNIFNLKLEKPLINNKTVNGSPVRLHLFNLIRGALNISRVCPFRGSSTCLQAYCGTFWTSMSNLRYLLIRSQILNSFKIWVKEYPPWHTCRSQHWASAQTQEQQCPALPVHCCQVEHWSSTGLKFITHAGHKYIYIYIMISPYLTGMR